MNESLYVVWNPNNRNPVVRHDSLISANQEAVRLADLNPNEEFIVLRAVKSIKRFTEPYLIKNYCKS